MRVRMTTGTSTRQSRARAHTHTYTYTHNYARSGVHTYISMCFSHLRQYSPAHMFKNS